MNVLKTVSWEAFPLLGTVVCIDSCGLLEHEVHCFRLLWLSQFLLRNQLLFWSLLYVPCIFFSCIFQVYFFVLYDVLTMICCGVFLFWSHLFGVLWASCSCAVYRLQNKSPHFYYYSLCSCLRPRHLVSCLSWKKVLPSFQNRINCPSVILFSPYFHTQAYTFSSRYTCFKSLKDIFKSYVYSRWVKGPKGPDSELFKTHLTLVSVRCICVL